MLVFAYANKYGELFMKLSTRDLAYAAMIAAIYAILTLFFQPIGYGPVQFRLAEALTVLPAIMPSSIPGLFVGCLLANILGGFGPVDIILGSLATLLAGISTYLLRNNKWLYPLPPIVFNGLIVGSYVYFLYDKTYSIALTILFISISEAVLTYGLGLPLISLIKRNAYLRKYFEIKN